MNTFFLRLRSRQRYFLSPLLFNMVLVILIWEISEKKEIKGISIGKEYVKLYLHMTSYIKNPKEPIKKMIELRNDCIKAVGSKLHIQISNSFLYTNSK